MICVNVLCAQFTYHHHTIKIIPKRRRRRRRRKKLDISTAAYGKTNKKNEETDQFGDCNRTRTRNDNNNKKSTRYFNHNINQVDFICTAIFCVALLMLLLFVLCEVKMKR